VKLPAGTIHRSTDPRRGGSPQVASAGAAPAVSVVIPTRDRRPLLDLTLAALADQQEAPPFEVVVADDGSSDGTARHLEDLAGRLPYPLRVLSLPAAGPAAARNRGIAVARAPRVLLLGDDTVPARDLLAAHQRAAAGREAGVQGRIDWHPELTVTPLMQFLAPEGPQFYFRGLLDGQAIPFTAVLGSNLSAPTNWFRDEPFDEGFPAAAFEDTEIAYRWGRRGRAVLWCEAARCFHHHRYDRLEDFLTRQQRAGRAARHAVARHPGMAWRTVVAPLAIGLVFAARLLVRRLAGQATATDLWDLRARAAFLRGLVSRPRRP
jgi:glycosyltransferase involved in cell wall biosynthesis